ncbi:unnamed protein product [Larinioides sclopetarius]|uniref:Uncharacterized protein n=1 Tax=Larinioides sclopetarius TaxID=280406 RepID=A0AAV2ADZ9_9ARAC
MLYQFKVYKKSQLLIMISAMTVYTGQMLVKRKVLLTDTLLHPVSLTILGKHMYWIDLDQQIIEMADEDTGALRQRVQRRISVLINLLGCQLLILTIILTILVLLRMEGVLPYVWYKGIIRNDVHALLHLVLSSDSSTCIDIPVCPTDKFRCLSGVTCFPDKWRADFDDMSDEMNCDVCKPQQFR